ncbi:MAG: KamA family radical SAM protein [Bacillota bacterium]|jgi:glutamate 2,3-aminomutase|nr:KamA family radical SAM protein [Bacillota bacterium]NLV62121.1 KamA family radical SAM protein [Clostridiaceae bacterium]
MANVNNMVPNNRFELLKNEILDYETAKNSILTGVEDYERIMYRKKRILEYLNADEKDYQDYRWQMKNRFTGAKGLAELIQLPDEEICHVNKVAEKYRFAVSPYYLSLIDPENHDCPIRKQSIPSAAELNDQGELDPMDEKGHAIQEIITRRYPDRLIIKVTNVCGMFCRFCQRRRMIGEFDKVVPRQKIQKAIDYIAENKELRDVLITGGDAFMVSDEMLGWMLGELRKIKHVEIIRLGTRTPVTLPQRVTKELVNILKKYHPIFVNTQFNHPMEVTPEAKQACEMLADAGIPLGNQMVLLDGVNNNKFVVRKLNQALLKIRVKPYYIFHPKKIKGTSHFWVKIEDGLEIMESLRGRTSGLAIPTYIINGPKGMGKTPILPNYLMYLGKNKAAFRNWQGDYFEVDN